MTLRVLRSRLFVRSRAEVEEAYAQVLKGSRLSHIAGVAFLLLLVLTHCIPYSWQYFATDWEHKTGYHYIYFFLAPLVVLSLSFLALAITVPYYLYRYRRQEFSLIVLGRLKMSSVLWLGGIAGLCLRLAMDLISYALSNPFPRQDNRVGNLGDSLLYILLGVLLVPLYEEVWFRFILQTQLQRLGVAMSIVFTIILFTCYHLTSWVSMPSVHELFQVIVFLPFFVLVSLTRWYTGSMLMCFVMHAVFML